RPRCPFSFSRWRMQVAGHIDPDDREAELCPAAYDYALPAELIAQEPAAERDGARLLVLERETGVLRHSTIRDLPAFLRAGDLLVFNRTRVRRARLFARSRTGYGVELLLLRDGGDGAWQCLGKPAKRLRAGSELVLPEGVEARVETVLGGGRYTVRFSTAAIDEILERCGEVPLPPYIKRPDGPL